MKWLTVVIVLSINFAINFNMHVLTKVHPDFAILKQIVKQAKANNWVATLPD